MPQAIAVQQRDGREDATDLRLHESAKVIKDFGKRIPSGHHLEDPSFHDEDGFGACAFRAQHPFRTSSQSSPFYPAAARCGRTIAKFPSASRCREAPEPSGKFLLSPLAPPGIRYIFVHDISRYVLETERSYTMFHRHFDDHIR